MARKKVGSDLFSQAASNRKAEQEAIELTIASGEDKPGRGRPVKNAEPTITVTVRMTEDRRRKLKAYAAMHGRSISDVLAEFIDGLED